MCMNDGIKIEELYDLNQTIATKLFENAVFPWEVLSRISSFIAELGATLSVEEYDNPNLTNKPVVVGGNSKRGIVTTANYKARKYGLHSAMPIFMAKSKCPGLIIVPTRMERYRLRK